MSEADVRTYAAERHFSAGTLARWLAEPPAGRDALLTLAQRLHLGENQFRDFYDDVADLAARDQGSIESVLDRAAVHAALARTGGRNEAVKALKGALRRLRYPQLSAVEDRLKAIVRQLRLPAGLKVEFPADLEGEDVTVRLRARSAVELRAQAAALAAAAQDPMLDEVFALLEGEVVKRFAPESVWIERAERDTALARTVQARCADRPLHWCAPGERPLGSTVRDGKRTLLLQRHRGGFLRHCPAGTAGLVCCNYLVVNLASNCPMDCSYCFLQDYLTATPLLTAYTNVEDALVEVDALLHAHPQRSFRIGTGELADSLALDPITGLSKLLVPFFAARPNAVLELKTKTDCIEELLALDPRGRVVVAWSVNAPAVIARDEPGTASLEERAAAARRVQAAGYRVGFHFDPLIAFEGWERGYAEAVEAIADSVDRDAIAWVSLGSLRLSSPLCDAIRRERGASAVLASELVPGPDGKARVWRGLRLRMYRFMVERIRHAFGTAPLYLCMEPPAVWERVMGDIPSDRALGIRLASGTAW